MNKIVYVIKDRVSNTWITRLMTAETRADMLRGFNLFLKEQPVNADCFQLVEFGHFYFSKEVGTVILYSEKIPIIVCNGSKAKEEYNKALGELEIQLAEEEQQKGQQMFEDTKNMLGA